MVIPWKAIPNAPITAIISVVIWIIITKVTPSLQAINWRVQYYYNVLII